MQWRTPAVTFVELSAMEADVSQDFQDYWNEYRILQETKRLDEYLDEQEEAARNLEDEGKITVSQLNIIIMLTLFCSKVTDDLLLFAKKYVLVALIVRIEKIKIRVICSD